MAELMEALTVDIPQIAFTKGNSMLIRTKVAANKTFTIAGSVPAVIDGSFMAEVYEGDRKIGEAYLNLPLAGAKGTATLRGHCLEGKPGGVYTVVIIPVALWLIEVYKASPVEVSKWRPIKEGGDRKVYLRDSGSERYAPQSYTRKDKVQSWKKTREYIASIESLPKDR